MTKRRVGFSASVLVAVTVLAVVLSTGAVASPPSTNGDPNKVVHHALTSAQMLTAEDMANAIPAPMPEAVGGPVIPSDPAELELMASGPIVVPGGFATMPQAQWYGAEPAYLPRNPHYSYPPPYTRYLASFWLYPQPPQRAVGKVFFKGPGGVGNYVCSGGVMAGRAVWTAGHCVYNNNLLPGTNGWSTNVWFCPYRRDGVNSPYGCYSASNLGTTNGWIMNMQQYDIGVIITNDKAGRKIAWDTGYLCAMFNASPTQHWNSFGYPAAAPFAGERQFVCSASTAWQDARWGTPWTNAMGCDMTGGSSGGPWLTRYQPGQAGAVNCVNGVNSYGYTSPWHPQVMYSSYFGTGALNLYNWGKVQ